MMVQDRAESPRIHISYGSFINQFQPVTIKSMWQLDMRYIKMCRRKMIILFNEICIKEEMLLREVPVVRGRCLWCNGYRRRIWARRHEFKSWTWLIAFHIVLIPLGNSELKPVKLRLKIDLVSYPARSEGLVNRIKEEMLPKCTHT